MRSEWQEVRLEDITSKIGDGLHGTPKYDNNGEYFFINGNNIGDGKITINENTKRVNYQEYLKHKKELTNRTILVSINGTLGSIGLYNNENVCLGKSACYVNVLEEVEKEFVKYILSSYYFQDYIHVYATGTTIKNMGLKAMRDFTFKLPPLQTQKKIAHILSTLDDKIELNRKTNQTLEEMAQAIFKSWFVDFDPVHAKAKCSTEEELERAAKELGISKEVLDLFHSEFEESELGMIPRGWEVKKFSQIGNVVTGKTPPTKNLENYGDKYQFITIPDMHNQTYIVSTERYLSEIGHLVQANKLVPKDSLIVSCIATVGLVSINAEDSHTNQQINNIVCDKKYLYYLYCMLSGMTDKLLMYGGAGTATLNINKSTFESIEVILPTDNELQIFLDTVLPMFEQILANTKQIQTLQKTRDTLLPKLLSGEIDVTEIEEGIE